MTEPGKLDATLLHDGQLIKLYADRIRYPDGSEADFEIVRHPGAAAVLPILGELTSADPTVLLLKQYRYATDGWLREIPAGKRDPSEPDDWEAIARRELEEETGMIAGRMEALTSIWMTPGFCDEVIHLFLATDLRPGTVAREADEFIETEVVPLSAALGMIRDGGIRDAKTICALLYAAGFLMGR